PIFIRLSQRMKLSVLKRCLVALTERHETLRTAFHRQEGMLTQCVSCACAPSLTFVDLRRFHPREREERLSRLTTEQSAQPFDLAQAPLLRATLYRLGPSDDRLLLVMHHIISDGW